MLEGEIRHTAFASLWGAIWGVISKQPSAEQGQSDGGGPGDGHAGADDPDADADAPSSQNKRSSITQILTEVGVVGVGELRSKAARAKKGAGQTTLIEKAICSLGKG